MDNPNPNQDPIEGQGGAAPDDVNNAQSQDAAPVEGQPQGQPTQHSIYNDIASKKGFKTPDDLAKSYSEAESELGRTKNVFNTTKQQLEAHGYTIDDKGNVVSISQQYQQQQQVPYGQQQQAYGQQQQEIYDPYTGQLLTNPIDIQLAQLPPSQRTAVVTNAIIEQREKYQADAFKADQEVLSSPQAKGFEQDVRNVMMSLPLAQRANKKNWEDALLRVKGAKYDDAIKGAGQQGVDEFINKAGVQSVPASGGTGGSVRLTPEQEETYNYYKQNHPDMFKDKSHFLRSLSPTGGR